MEINYVKCTKCNQYKIYNNKYFAIERKERICRECRNKIINIGKWKRKHGIELDFDKMYDTCTPIEWYKMQREGKFRRFPMDIMKVDKCIEIVRYVIMEELGCKTRESILQTKRKEVEKYVSGRVLNVIDETYINILIKSFPEFEFKIYDSKILPKGFIRRKENADEYMRHVINLLVNKFKIVDYKTDIPQLFKPKVITELGFNTLYHCITKYKHYDDFYEWLNYLYPEWGLDESDFSIFVTNDGKVCDSLQEKRIYDFIFSNFNVEIEPVGTKRTNGYYNEEYNETYYPDFKIEKINNQKLNKSIIIEYYGLYKDCLSYDKNDVLYNYKNKTKRKNEYYNQNNQIVFVPLYPADLNKNMKGVHKKIAQALLKGGENCIEKEATLI